MDTKPNNAPEEVRKLQGESELNKTSSHDERQNPEKVSEDIDRDKPKAGEGSAEDINKKYLPDDAEQYAHEDNAEARDSRRPYEDVITPESYDSSLADNVKKMPNE